MSICNAYKVDFPMKRTLIRVVLFLLLYFFIFGPNLKPLDFLFPTVFLFSVYFLCLSFINGKVDSSYGLLTFSIFPVIIYSLFISIFSKGNEYIFFIELLKFSFFITGSFGVVSLYSRMIGPDWFKILLCDVVNACILVAITTLIIFLFDPVKQFVLNVVSFKMADNIQVLKGMRSIDISVGGGTALSLVFVFGFVLVNCLYLWGGRDSYKNSLASYLFILSSLVTARTGFMVTCLLYVSFIVINIFHEFFHVSCDKRTRIKHFAINIVIISCFVSYALYQYNDLIFNVMIPWAFELFINAAESKSISSASTSDLLNNHYSISLTETNYIFGGGTFLINSDVGPIKILSSVGIVGAIFLSANTICFVFLICNATKSINFTKFEKHICVSVLVFWLLIFVVNFKELIFSNSRGAFVLIVLCSVAVICNSSLVNRINKVNIH